jgi:hypothetical protein
MLWCGLLAAGGSDFLYTEAPAYDENALLHGRDRFPAGAWLKIVTAGHSRLLFPAFAATADAAVSFDGKRVLFAGKRSQGDTWRIWEAPLAGGEPQPVTPSSDDCIRPLYAAEDQIVYARRVSGEYQLEMAPREGGPAKRLTWNPGNHLPAMVMSDGRVLYEAERTPGLRDIYAVYSDGSGVETIRCDHGSDRHSPVEVASGDIVFRTGAGLARFTSSLAAQVEIPLPPGEYRGPVAETAPGDWLVSWRGSRGAQFSIHRLKAGRLPVPAGTGSAFQPVAIRARRPPPYHPSSLGKRQGASVLCLNAYETKGPKIPPGSAASVRVWALDVPLGVAPVEADGSFFLQLPSERPLRFELLDGAGKTLRASKAWYWMRKGEQRVCVGCHAGPERAPDNVVPEALRRTQTPVRLGVAK